MLELCGPHDEARRWGFGGKCMKTGWGDMAGNIIGGDFGDSGKQVWTLINELVGILHNFKQ